MTKPYKCRVEYLESTGTQWIDTGIAPSNITPIAKLKFIPTQQFSSGSYGIFGCFGANNTRFQVFYNSIGIGTYVSKSWQANTTYEVELNGKIPSATINGTVETSGYSTANGFSSDNMYLFTRNNGNVADNGVPLKLYYCKIWNNELLVRDFIPVLDLSGKPAMYDQVSGKLFYNKGTGEFTYGRQIIPVEYLESSGTQYIDTGIKGKNNLHYKTKVNFTTLSTGGSNGIGGEYLANASAYIGMVRANGHYTYLFNNTAVETTTTIYANTDYEIDSVMNSGSQVLKVNGETISTGALSGTFTSTRNIFLYAVCSTNDAADVYGSLKMYYCQIYDNDTLVRDFIPCIDENHVPFMFDKVHNTVYLNAGTGQFKVGPNVEKTWGGKKLRRKLALALANLKKKRPFYCELEYLESTGTQYIDTGLLSTENSKVDCVFGFSSMESGIPNNCAVFGGRSSSNYQYNTFTLFKLAGANPQYFRFDYNAQRQVGTSANMAWNTTSTYEFTYNGSIATTTNLSTNETANYNVSPGSTFTTAPIALFAVNSSGTVGNFLSGRIYKYWYTDGTNTIDLIPVLDWNYVPCMFDRVSEQLFYNAGTGDFIAGREIHPVDYLETDGTSYINTGYTPSGSTETEITTMLKNQNTSRFMFGCRTANGQDIYACLSHTSNRIGYRVGTGGYLYSSGYDELNTKHTYKIANGVFYRDDEVINTTCEGATTSPNSPLALLTVNTNNILDYAQTFVGNFYSCTVKDNNVLVRDFIPAIDSNGIGYMFDRVTHTIFDNAGTGAFKYPAREVEYLTSNGNQYIDTGIQPTDDYGYRIKNTYTAGGGEQCAIGCMDAGNRFVGIYTGGPANAISGAWGDYVGFLPNYPWTTGTILEVKCNYKNDRKIIIDQTEMKDITDTHISGTISNSIYIGARNYGSNVTKMRGNIYCAEITNGQNVVADFIPAFKDGVACMVDKLTGTAYLNQGTGSFSVGRIMEPEYE